MNDIRRNVLIWVLKIGVFGTFFGHGMIAFGINGKWISYLETVGFSSEMAVKIMPSIGVLDMLVAIIILVKPIKPVLIWAIIWAFATALIRPLSGESVLAFVERSANWVLPFALYLCYYKFEITPSNFQDEKFTCGDKRKRLQSTDSFKKT